MSKKLVVVQQYLSWKGHYRQYFENLFDPKYNYLYASNTREEGYKNAEWIKSDFDAEKQLTIKTKILGRFIDSFKAFKNLGAVKFDVIHLIEFEPLTFLLLAKRFKHSKLIITIHSSDKLHFSSWFSSRLSSLQRNLLNRALRAAAKNGATIVTHYECHKESVLEIVGRRFQDKVHVVEYPAPQPKFNRAKVLNTVNISPAYLIYGQIREDKGIYEFLKNESTRELRITIAGKIVDRRIFEFKSYKNLTIIDKFLSNDEISELIEGHDYMLLPYPLEYTNGAGTFKDSLSMGMPVICSKIPIFEEIIDKHQVGVTFGSPDEILAITQSIDSDSYEQLSRKCLQYALTYNWAYMRERYFSIYEQVLNSYT